MFTVSFAIIFILCFVRFFPFFLTFLIMWFLIIFSMYILFFAEDLVFWSPIVKIWRNHFSFSTKTLAGPILLNLLTWDALPMLNIRNFICFSQFRAFLKFYHHVRLNIQFFASYSLFISRCHTIRWILE